MRSRRARSLVSDKLRLMCELPGLVSSVGFEITSPKEVRYNCIGYAVQDDRRWWWPDKANQYFWPPGVPREQNLDSFIAAFETLGFQLCNDETHEPGFDKIALFTKPAGTVTHAARQFPDGGWRSKLGRDHDISHALRAIEG